MATMSKLTKKGTLNYFFEKQRQQIEVSNQLPDQDKEGPVEQVQPSKDQVSGNKFAFSAPRSVLGLGLDPMTEQNEKSQEVVTNHNGVDSSIKGKAVIQSKNLRAIIELQSGKSKDIDPLSLPDIGEQPNQPGINYAFPKCNIAGRTRSFQHSWFHKFQWIHYDEHKDLALCHICVTACRERKIHAPYSELAFIKIGFKNWKKALEKFKSHAASACHRDATEVILKLPKETTDIAEQFERSLTVEKKKNRRCFLKTVSTLRMMGRQGLPLQGLTEEESNFYQILKLRGEDDPEIKENMVKSRNKYTCYQIQNEVIQLMALQIQRVVASRLHETKFITIMMDETPDKANKEQCVFCMRHVDDDLEVHEDFIGLYEIESTKSDVLVQVTEDVMSRLNLPFSKVRGQCYDGASALSGAKNGVAKQIRDKEERALYTHCYGHALNLACSDAVKNNRIMKDALDTTREITKLIKRSPKRDLLFEKAKLQLAPDSPGIRVLCPTRWTVNANACSSIIDNYQVLLQVWEESLKILKDSEQILRIKGVQSQMKNFDYLFGVMLSQKILKHSDNLSKTLQRGDISAADGQTVARMTVKTLENMRTEEGFDIFWSLVMRAKSQHEVSNPCLPRPRKRPARFEEGNARAEFHEEAENYYRQIYYEALDTSTSAIKERFDQDGYNKYIELETYWFVPGMGKTSRKSYNGSVNFTKMI